MKILFLSANFSVLSQTFVYDRVCGLSERGHDVHVATLNRSMVEQRPYEKVHVLKKDNPYRRLVGKLAASPAVRILKRVLSNRTDPTRTKLEIAYSRSLDRFVRDSNSDVLHAEFGQMGVLANRVAIRRNKPLIVYMHGYDITQLPIGKKWFDAYRQLWRPNVLVMTPSEFMRQKVIDLGADPGSVVVQHNGIDLDRWSYSDPATRYSGKVSFLFVGRLVEKKGPREVVRAFALMRKKAVNVNSELVICGTGPLEEAVKSDVREFGLTECVHMLGSCSHDEVRAQMHRCHIMVQHSVTADNGDMEGLPVSLTEAAAIGLPIVATRHSGIPEIVRDGINGYLVDEHDVEGMADILCNLATSPEKWSYLASNGRQIVEAQFDKNAVLSDYERHLSRIVDGLSAI